FRRVGACSRSRGRRSTRARETYTARILLLPATRTSSDGHPPPSDAAWSTLFHRSVGSALRVALVVGLAGTLGCSAIFVRATPRGNDAARESYCSSAGWVAADAASALGIALLTGWAVSQANSTNGYNGCDTNPTQCNHSTGAGGYIAAAAFAASALYGGI